MEEDVFYSDFNGIRITSKKFYAGEKAYAIRKIQNIDLQRVIPNKGLGLALFSIGVIAILLGSFTLLGSVSLNAFDAVWLIDLDIFIIAIGVVALIIAIIRILISPDEYAVKVNIKGENIEAITSDNRKYAARIAASLKRAYYRQHSKTEIKGKLITS